MAIPTRLERGKIISAIDGVVDTWDWFINFLNGIKGKNGVVVERTASSIDISLDNEGDGDDDDDDSEDDSLPEIPELPTLDLSGTLNANEYISGDDTNIVFTPVTDQSSPNYGKIKVDVYWL